MKKIENCWPRQFSKYLLNQWLTLKQAFHAAASSVSRLDLELSCFLLYCGLLSLLSRLCAFPEQRHSFLLISSGCSYSGLSQQSMSRGIIIPFKSSLELGWQSTFLAEGDEPCKEKKPDFSVHHPLPQLMRAKVFLNLAPEPCFRSVVCLCVH